MSIAERIEQELVGAFWTRIDELVQDIEELGYNVTAAYDEYIVASQDEDDGYIIADDEEENEVIIYLGHANTTMWIEKIREV